MATPWYIKVRADLHTDARVLRISEIIDPQGSLASAGLFGTSQLSVTTVLRDVSTAALQRVWIHACNHTCDGVFRHVTSLAYLDTLAGYPKFGEAMAAVGWAKFDKVSQTITLPDFLDWNTPAKAGPRGGRPGNPESPGALRTRKSREKRQLQPPVTTPSQPRNNGATTTSQADIGRGRGTLVQQQQHAGEELPINGHRLHPHCLQLEAEEWAQRHNTSVLDGVRITPEIAVSWWEDRTRSDWQIAKHGTLIPLTTPRAVETDLVAYARSWAKNELFKPKTHAAKRAEREIPSTSTASSLPRL